MQDFSRSFRGFIVGAPLAAAIAVLVGATSAHAQAIVTESVYSNTTNFLGFAFANGGATTGSLVTTTAADDINLLPNATGNITGLSFSVGNLNAAAVSANVILSFYSATGTSGGPGTLLGALEFNPISFGVGVAVFTYSPGTTIFTATGGSFWVGETFVSTTATAAQLNELGEGIFSPPTIGSSADQFFVSSGTGSSDFDASNPSGTITSFGGNPPANFGFSFTGTANAPEPSAVLLSLSGGLLTVSSLVRRRRSK